ncbi:MAG TPA: glycerol-3-phosphate dehydrogenase, partial [Bacteroidetes bacterium]|nr:glycerol-3-phosphate dehydrogenase [Bacteroidota bacterium]
MADRFAVVGGGSWGTALAIHLRSAGHDVRIWEPLADRAEEMARTRENRIGLPGVHVPEEILVTSDLGAASEGVRWLVFALPSHVLRRGARQVAALDLPWDEVTVVSGTKGLEIETFSRMTQVLAEELPVPPGRIVALSGPSHAEEVSRGIPTAVVVACPDVDTARRTQSAFMTPRFRVYASPDVTGVELGGALKNVMAVASGIS